jgi:hypothetical protein
LPDIRWIRSLGDGDRRLELLGAEPGSGLHVFETQFGQTAVGLELFAGSLSFCCVK